MFIGVRHFDKSNNMLKEYKQHGDIVQYKKEVEKAKQQLESIKQDIEDCKNKKKILHNLAGLKEEEEVLRDILQDLTNQVEDKIFVSSENFNRRIEAIDFQPILDDDELIANEELKSELSKSIRERCAPKFFSNYQPISSWGEKIEWTYSTRTIVANLTMFFIRYIDMLIDKKIGNPFKKGLGKSLEIFDKCIDEVCRESNYMLLHLEKDPYIQFKRKQIETVYKIEKYKADKAEEKRIMLQMQREEMAAQKEIERELKKAAKDERDAQAKLEKRQMELAQAKSEAEIAKLNEQIKRLQDAIEDAQQRNERALSMAQQGRAGHVYIISNIGSFGEDVFKIGMTRRIDPMDRVVELGDASVPFPFDVHAMIWTEDAPALETALHHAFQSKRVNAINGKKEFFKVSIEDIRKELQRIGVQNQLVEFPTAAQFRDSLALRKTT